MLEVHAGSSPIIFCGFRGKKNTPRVTVLHSEHLTNTVHSRTETPNHPNSSSKQLTFATGFSSQKGESPALSHGLLNTHTTRATRRLHGYVAETRGKGDHCRSMRPIVRSIDPCTSCFQSVENYLFLLNIRNSACRC